MAAGGDWDEIESTYKAEADKVADLHHLGHSLFDEIRARDYHIEQFQQVDYPKPSDQGVHITRDNMELITVVSPHVALSTIEGMNAILNAEKLGMEFPLARRVF